MTATRCPVCDMTCSACADRPPDFDTPDGPACGTCVANAVFGGPDVIESTFTEHRHDHDRADSTTRIGRAMVDATRNARPAWDRRRKESR